jgi:hypothetical protein
MIVSIFPILSQYNIRTSNWSPKAREGNKMGSNREGRSEEHQICLFADDLILCIRCKSSINITPAKHIVKVAACKNNKTQCIFISLTCLERNQENNISHVSLKN